jgi:hypothetical protein
VLHAAAGAGAAVLPAHSLKHSFLTLATPPPPPTPTPPAGSGEATTKFWVRPRPGDPWRDALHTDEEAAASSYADLLAALPQQVGV